VRFIWAGLAWFSIEPFEPQTATLIAPLTLTCGHGIVLLGVAHSAPSRRES